MRFFTAAATAVGIGTSIYGASQQRKQIKQSNRATAEANRLQKEVSKEQQKAAAASQRAEGFRKQQMELEGIRRRRDIIRQAQGARALGIARANAGGAAMTDSSVIAGQQQAASQQRADTLANLQNIQIGRNIYAENKKITEAQGKGATIQTQANDYMSQAAQRQNQAAYSQQIFGAGIQLAQNAPTLSRVAQGVTDIFNRPAVGNWDTTVNFNADLPLK
jgi:hypothetical protein